MASNKIKGFVSDSKVSVDDVKARMKYQSLMEDYEELQKDIIERQSRLEATREKKQILAAEVRFLRRKYRLLTMTKDTTRSTQDQPLIPSSTCVKQTRSAKKHTIDREETNECVLASGSVSQPKERYLVSQQQSLVAIYLEKKSREGHKRSFWTRIVPKLLSKASFGPKWDADRKENSNPVLDLNYDSSHHNVKEHSLKARTLDLNKMGDADISINVEANKFDEYTKADENSSRARKRKVSWKDPISMG